MICGASHQLWDRTVTDEIREATIRQALNELARHIEFNHTYQFSVEHETVRVEDRYDEYRVLIRIEEVKQ